MLQHLQNAPIIPVFYHSDAGYATDILAASYQGGLRVFEFTLRGTSAFQVFGALKAYAEAHCPGLLLGIGTIYTAADANRFLDAGADFIVQPITVPLVGEACRASGKPWIPGAFTPTEIWTAREAGADLVKIFPGSAVGPAYVQALRGPMPDVPLIATGGISPEPGDIRQWLRAGVHAVGIGTQLFQGADRANYTALSEKIAGLITAVHL